MKNPYSTPNSESNVPSDSASSKKSLEELKARNNVVIVGFFLSIACFFNLVSFFVSAAMQVSGSVSIIPIAIISFIIAGGFFILNHLFTLTVLVFLSKFIRAIVGYTVPPDQWHQSFLSSFDRYLRYGIAISICWCFFVFSFYFVQIDFLIVANITAVLIHLCAGLWYAPLFYDWYKLRNASIQKS